VTHAEGMAEFERLSLIELDLYLEQRVLYRRLVAEVGIGECGHPTRRGTGLSRPLRSDRAPLNTPQRLVPRPPPTAIRT
jgi:hypothetical protein